MTTLEAKLKNTGWSPIFQEFFRGKNAKDLLEHLTYIKFRREQGDPIFPPGDQMFRAFELCHYDNVKVVILGQDPYHGDCQANGLAFAVGKGQVRPPSLRNILKELERDIKQPIPETSSTLEGWAQQGVLLLNSIMTVPLGKPGGHAGKGWEEFTDFILQKINEEKRGVVFMLWGKYAQLKASKTKSYFNLTLEAAHPSPLSVHKGFFGCNHFSKANEFLELAKKQPINWLKIDTEQIGKIAGHLILCQEKE